MQSHCSKNVLSNLRNIQKLAQTANDIMPDHVIHQSTNGMFRLVSMGVNFFFGSAGPRHPKAKCTKQKLLKPIREYCSGTCTLFFSQLDIRMNTIDHILPTCQVRVVGFYVSQLRVLRLRVRVLLVLLLRLCECSVACRTSTAIM